MSVRNLAWLFVPVGIFGVFWGAFLLFAGWTPLGYAFSFSGLSVILTYLLCRAAADDDLKAVRGEVSRG